ncbi:MAG TPA: ParB/RepB/Spo0J family partition protein, partial [Kiloniellaceae bacterium]|nr:ParB/RepB/Spo0J family partition protein [Kiloniellaceae bacterium]
MTTQEIAFANLHPSPLNPRTQVDPDKLAVLATSIESEGILQNLTARPHPKKAGHFEIIAGATRYLAFEKLVKAKKRQPSDTLPVRVKEPCSDLDVVELAIIENVQRDDLHPLDEAAGYAKLRELGKTPADIEKLIPQGKRHVQLRLQLHDNLTKDAKTAFRKGAFALQSARVLAALCPKGRQDGVLKRIAAGDHNYQSPAVLQSTLRDASIPLRHAIFPRDQYKGAVLVDEPENNLPDSDFECVERIELAADIEEFWRLQREA